MKVGQFNSSKQFILFNASLEKCGITGLRVINEKANVGDATILGNENLFSFNINELLSLKPQFQINYYLNLYHINSEYLILMSMVF